MKTRDSRVVFAESYTPDRQQLKLVGLVILGSFAVGSIPLFFSIRQQPEAKPIVPSEATLWQDLAVPSSQLEREDETTTR